MKALNPVRTWAAAGALAALLAACTAMGPPAPGATLDQVRSRWGEPRARYAVADGQHLFYQRKPGALERLDFDASGRLVKTEQVFTAEHFRALAQGQWTAVDVQQSFGPPARRIALAQQQDDNASVWIYSWLEFGVWHVAQVRMSAAGVVQSVDFSRDAKADDRYR